MPDIELDFFSKTETMQARALFVGDRIELRALETASALALTPLTIAAGGNGCAVLFRYGVVKSPRKSTTSIKVARSGHSAYQNNSRQPTKTSG